MKTPKKHVLVSGGSSGIGAEIVRAYARLGCDVHAIYNTGKDRVAALAKQCEDLPGTVFGYKADLSDPPSVAKLESELARAAPYIDSFVHSAVHEIPKPIDEATFDEWRSVISVKLDGAFLLTKLFLKLSEGSPDPSIVYITSIDGEKPDGDYIAYQVATAGLIALTKAQAVYAARKYRTRVNAVGPGPTPSPLWTVAGQSPEMWEKFKERTPVGRVASAEDVARCCVFLTEDEGRFLNGVFLDVDGGLRWT